MKYKNLFFDLDDTIWAFSRNARDTFEEVYQKYSFDRYFDSFDHYYTLYQRRNTELWLEYGKGKVTKEELNRQRFFYPLQAVGFGRTFLGRFLCHYSYQKRSDAPCQRSVGVSCAAV